MTTSNHRNWQQTRARWFVMASLAASVNVPVICVAADGAASGIIEEVVTLGTRREPRAAIDTAVAVDVFNSEALESINSPDMVDVISTLVPSFNVTRRPISDGATVTRPVSLRGLDTHHTLVLVNGKRRHRAALLDLFGAFGAHGPDVGTIPTIALRNVEVLRDGAAAQYGSDAIAGVLNFNLRNAREGSEFRVRYGEYGERDGENLTLEGNIGLPLGASGFLNISGQYADIEATSRAQRYSTRIGNAQYNNADGDTVDNPFYLTPFAARNAESTVDGTTYYGPDAYTNTYNDEGQLVQSLRASDGIPDYLNERFSNNFSRIGGSDNPFPSITQSWGQPDQEQVLLFANGGLPLTDEIELYGHGNYSTKEVSTGFFYRRPDHLSLQPVRLADGTIYNPRDRLYPAGYRPRFTGEVTDVGGAFGIRGIFANGVDFDLSLSFGENEVEYTIENTLNPSLGPDTPVSFRPGNLINSEWQANADFSHGFEAGFASPISVAFGAEFRDENYEITNGDEASYADGNYAQADPHNLCNTDGTPTAAGIAAMANGLDCAEARDPVYNALPVASNGFPGTSPNFTTDRGRESYAFYVDFETDITESWLVNLAARYENFSDFGDVAIAKFATRYALSDNVNLRASIGTGFRAPTMGQISTLNISTRIADDGSPIVEGLFPADSAPAAILGGSKLEAEDSFSWTIGLTSTPLDGLTLTLDWYLIELDDRITVSSAFEPTDPQRAALSALNIPGASEIAQVRFFTNDSESETSGVDLVATYEWDWAVGSSSVALAWNWTSTEITKAGRFIGRENEFDIEHNIPEHRANLTARNSWQGFDVMLRGRYFGEYQNGNLSGGVWSQQDFDATVYVDLELGYTFMDRYRITAGGWNIFDEFPDEANFEACCGAIYRSDSVPDWQGQQWYLQASVQF